MIGIFPCKVSTYAEFTIQTVEILTTLFVQDSFTCDPPELILRKGLEELVKSAVSGHCLFDGLALLNVLFKGSKTQLGTALAPYPNAAEVLMNGLIKDFNQYWRVALIKGYAQVQLCFRVKVASLPTEPRLNVTQWYDTTKATHTSIHRAVFKLRLMLKAFGIRPQHMKPVDVKNNELTFMCTDAREQHKYSPLHVRKV